MKVATSTFEISVLSSTDGQTYIGKFKVRNILTPIQFIEQDRLYRALIGENPQFADQHAIRLSLALSQLEYRIIESPPFWDNGEGIVRAGHLPDDVVLEVFDRCIQAELKYRSTLISESYEASDKIRQEVDKQDSEKEKSDR